MARLLLRILLSGLWLPRLDDCPDCVTSSHRPWGGADGVGQRRLKGQSVSTSTEVPAKKSGGTRIAVQKFGTFLSGMIMPNIAAFIAWGLITALFIEKGWFPVAKIGGWGEYANAGLVGPMVTYMLPILIAAQGGRMVYELVVPSSVSSPPWARS